MSDLASWALRGLRGSSNNNNNNNNNNNDDSHDEASASTARGNTMVSSEDNLPPLTAEEMRAQRLQRMLQQQEQQQQSSQDAQSPGNEESLASEPMDVDETMPPSNTTSPTNISTTTKKPNTSTSSPRVATVASLTTATTPPEIKKKRKQQQSHSDATAPDMNRKLQRKKELLLRKVLQIALAGTMTAASTATMSDSTMVVLDTGSTDISVQTMAEILATRLFVEDETGTTAKPLMAYLAQAHRKACEEIQTLRQQSNRTSSSNTGTSTAASPTSSSLTTTHVNDVLEELLQEMAKQTVSYAATCLQEPDLFPSAANAAQQLKDCLCDGMANITFGISGPNSSFYHCLMEELQQNNALEPVIQQVVQLLMASLTKVESVLDDAGSGVSPLVLVSALVSLCTHKKAAWTVAHLDSFCLPLPHSPEAQQVIMPPMPTANPLLRQFMAGLQPSFKRRSGPALEKYTLLGLVLRVGIPKNNPAFTSSTLRQSMASVEAATLQQRGQLRVYQQACHQLLRNLIKGGPAARARIMLWFQDALLVNVGADATRPDPSKVSGQSLLLNMSVCLTKLCEPVVQSEGKHELIDPKFLSSPSAHGGVFTTEGDDAIPRLGQQDNDDDNERGQQQQDMDEYNPNNAFIPQVCYFCARSLHLGLASLLAQHEHLLRTIGHAHWVIAGRGGDLATDPHFGMYIARQRSQEVALYQEDMVHDALAFGNLMAKHMMEVPDDVLPHIPEHFVSDLCDIFTSIAKRKPSLLRGIHFASTFQVVVKLLSPKYAPMVRNYNLRAMLGDTLYEVFLPLADGTENDVPESVYTDATKGQSYLLADPVAQETLAPSLLLLYGEVEHTGYYDKMSHRAKIASIIKYLWDSTEHRQAFRRITQNRESFIKFANGIMNETNTLIATVMQKLPEIREAQAKMKGREWAQMTEEQQKQIQERLEENEREVKHALPLCNKTLKMFGYLNTDTDIRELFLLDELCPRLVQMLLHVLTKLVGSRGLELKVDNPEELEFKPKIMLQDLCLIFSHFATANTFQVECAKSGCDPTLLQSALKTAKRLNLLQGERLAAFELLPALVQDALEKVAQEEALLQDAPTEFEDEILGTLMQDPVKLPSGHVVDRSTIAQHLLNDPTDPFNRNPLSMDDIEPAVELKARIDAWIAERRSSRG